MHHIRRPKSLAVRGSGEPSQEYPFFPYIYILSYIHVIHITYICNIYIYIYYIAYKYIYIYVIYIYIVIYMLYIYMFSCVMCSIPIQV
jgi:hypothetical protein